MSLVKTYLQDIRANYPSNLDRDELRRTTNGILTAVMEMTKSPRSIVSADLREKVAKSQGLNVDVPVMKKGAVTISNVRSCVIAGGKSASDLIRLVWKTVSVDIMMVPAQYEKNMIKYRDDLALKIGDAVEALKIEIENDLDTALNANKTQVYNSTIVGTTYTLTGGAIQVPESKQQFFFNDLTPINFADDFNYPIIKVIASHSVMSMAAKWMNQGQANQTNTQFQFAGKGFTYSNQVTVGAGKTATGYFMPEGTVGLLTRVDADARLGSKATDGTEWFEDTLPGLPFPVGFQYKSKCEDQSLLEAAGLAHLKATKVEHWQISFDYAMVFPYNSDPATKAGAIRKFDFTT